MLLGNLALGFRPPSGKSQCGSCCRFDHLQASVCCIITDTVSLAIQCAQAFSALSRRNTVSSMESEVQGLG